MCVHITLKLEVFNSSSFPGILSLFDTFIPNIYILVFQSTKYDKTAMYPLGLVFDGMGISVHKSYKYIWITKHRQ